MSFNLPRIAIFLATSGHSGVDRIMKNLIHGLAAAQVPVDLLRIKGHGPHLPELPPGARSVRLGVSHVQGALPALTKYLKSERPFAILSDKDRVNRTAILARAISRSQTKIAVRIGTTVSENLRRRDPMDRLVQRLSMRLLYPRADAILVPSSGAAEDLSRFARIPRDRITVVKSPILTPDFEQLAGEPVGHPLFAEDRPVVLGAGELCSRKDFATLMRAFAILLKSTPARLIILGEGRKRPALEALAIELGIKDAVSMPGFVPNPYPFMKKASLFVLSSTCEGMPVVLVEAMAAGCPVVATDCPSGPREVLAGGKYGALVPVGDPEALAVAMRRTLEAPPKAHILAEAAAHYCVEEGVRTYLAALGYPAHV